MNIKFNSKPGEIYDYFKCLEILTNWKEFIEEQNKKDIKISEKYIQILKEIKEKFDVDKPIIQFYFKKYDNLNLVNSLIDCVDIWKYLSVYDYLKYINDLNDMKLKEQVAQYLLFNMNYSFNEIEQKAKVLSENNEKFLKTIRESNIDAALKWNIFSFIENPSKYKEDFINVMKEFISVYKEFISEIHREMKSFNLEVKKNIDEKGIVYLKECFFKRFDIETGKNIYVTTTYMNYRSSSFYYDKKENFIYIGRGIEELKNKLQQLYENNISIYKCLGDKNRFEILKLITKGEKYSNGDLAKKLNISGATVSYHINSLFMCNLIKVNKNEKKLYYVLDKEVLKNSIEFIKQQLSIN